MIPSLYSTLETHGPTMKNDEGRSWARTTNIEPSMTICA